MLHCLTSLLFLQQAPTANQEPTMSCAVSTCFVEDPTVVIDPCSHCGKPTHHMCSNSVHESELHERWCSLQCVLAGTAGTSVTTDLRAYVKIAKTKPKTKGKASNKGKAKKVEATTDSTKTRKYVLSDLRKAYVGKVVAFSGKEVTGSIDDKNTCY